MSALTIGLVGPCTSGKSTIRAMLEEKGFHVRHIAQEHSFAPRMWRLIANPDVLIFLDVSYPATLKRRNWSWTIGDYVEQQRRLSHARSNADLVIETDRYTPQEIADQIAEFVGKEAGITWGR